MDQLSNSPTHVWIETYGSGEPKAVVVDGCAATINSDCSLDFEAEARFWNEVLARRANDQTALKGEDPSVAPTEVLIRHHPWTETDQDGDVHCACVEDPMAGTRTITKHGEKRSSM